MNKQSSPENLHIATPALRAADKAAAKARASAKPVTAKRTCIMVLGMHRSGTSALTRAISLLGAELPKNMLGANPTNETGHWEPLRLMELHDRMLAEAGSRWDDWRPFDPNDLGAARLRLYKAEIARLIDEEYGSAPFFVLKEPRISRFVPLYAEILKRMKVDVRYVLIQRNPLAVIASLEKRDGFTSGFSALLWLRHELEAEHATRGRPRVFVSYEATLKDWRIDIERIAAALQIDWPQSITKAQAALSVHFSTDHQHHRASVDLLGADPRIADWVKQAYTALRGLEEDSADTIGMAQLDAVRTSFDHVTPVFGEAFFHEIDARTQKSIQASSQVQRLADDRAAEINRQAVELATLHQEIRAKDAEDTHRYTTELEELRVELAKQQNALRRSMDESSAREASLMAEIGRNKQGAAQAEQRAQRMTEEAQVLKREILKMRSSYSWKLTYPARLLKSLLNGSRR
ncbi:hypothetical protein CN311_28630 [Mesorhizobium sanjuanii]|uniref:Sulfotransferase family protein n=1 Tax=Mesorhizobium sanjuanii TaxID=2037900 RepID=A0A2A6F7G5_9HYPH|nr:sulfotransferase [Mesorhizobium sanjuanii]PDQ17693.1 hypothetical protein CN311_28630 [Mesorhizobium sanjuanii]